MKVAVVCGSHELYLDEKALAGQFIIGVDRGAFHLLKRGISPDLAIGDFDSVTPEEYDAVSQATRELIHLPCEKDETDTEAALNLALQRGASEVTLYGALGGRIDHTLANIRLLLQFVKKGLYVQLVGEKNRLTVLSKGEHHLEATAFKYLSSCINSPSGPAWYNPKWAPTNSPFWLTAVLEIYSFPSVFSMECLCTFGVSIT